MNFLEIPKVLYLKEFDVLREGTHIAQEKRSPRDIIPEQSLWSYGGTYSTDFDVCQVVETKFFPVLMDNLTKIRSVRPSNLNTVGDIIQNGEIKIFLKNEKKKYYYQSFFIKNINPSKVHIHFKKI